MARPGPACDAASDENVRQLETTALPANRHIKVRELSQMLSISMGTVHSIIHSLGYHKVAAQWIPRLLTDEQKNLRLASPLQHLMRYQQQGDVYKRQVAYQKKKDFRQTCLTAEVFG